MMAVTDERKSSPTTSPKMVKPAVAEQEVTQCSGQVGDPRTRRPGRGGHVAGVGHHEGGHRGDQRGEDHRPEHEGEHGQEFAGEQDGTSGLTDEELAQRA